MLVSSREVRGWFMSMDVDEFVAVAGEALQRDPPDVVARVIAERWTADELTELLNHSSVKVRRLAAAAVGMVGSCENSNALGDALHDDDELVRELAEHSLWTIWFACCQPQARESFQQGLNHLEQEAYEKAVESFEACQRIAPNYAEAYHQCGIARYLLGDWYGSLEECEKTLELIPIHFGALNQMGHCYTHLGQWENALNAYRSALRTNPQMTDIHYAIERLSRRVG